MVKLSKIQLLTYGLPLLVILASVFLGLSSFSKTHPHVTALLAYDLAVFSPLVYFLFIRKQKISKLTVIPFITLGIVIASFLLPKDQQYHLNIVKAIAIPAVELFILAILLKKGYALAKSMKSNSVKIDDAYVIIKESCFASFGRSKFSAFLISEISVLYYGLLAWKKKIPSKKEFTNYKDNGTIPLLWGVIFVMGVETAVLHILISKWSGIAAWVLTILSLYTVLMVFGHFRALSRRLSIIKKDRIILKNGLIATIEIDLKDIKEVELFSGQISEPDDLIGNLGLAKESNDHNVALYFLKPQTIEKFYGITQKCDRLLFFIDDKYNFVEKVKDKLA